MLEKVKFENLILLDLEYNNISDINVLEKVNFKDLKELSLGVNNIIDIKVLEKVSFEKLEKLNIHNNSFNINEYEETLEFLKSKINSVYYY